jgi:hypothetical protein
MAGFVMGIAKARAQNAVLRAVERVLNAIEVWFDEPVWGRRSWRAAGPPGESGFGSRISRMEKYGAALLSRSLRSRRLCGDGK